VSGTATLHLSEGPAVSDHGTSLLRGR